MLRELEQATRARCSKARASPAAEIVTERTADMRLFGQIHEINVALPEGAITDDGDARDPRRVRRRLRRALHIGLCRRRGAARLVARALPRPRCRNSRSHRRAQAARASRAKGRARRSSASGFVETPVYDRYALAAGRPLAGPAIIEEREATTIVAPGDTVHVDASGTLRIAVGVAAPAVARITQETPLAEAMAAIETDPVSLEIMWARLVTVVEEMWHTICRTAFSLIVSEAQDFACDLLDADGEGLAHSPRAMPVFNLTLPRAVKALLAKFPAAHAATRRRARYQRSVALRRPSVRHRRRHAGVPRRARWSR